MKILLGWAINALSLLALPYLLSSVKISGLGTALVAALVIGVLNVVIRPILFILTLPITLLTLGLFTFVLNGLIFWLASRWIEGFSIDGFGWAILAAMLYSLITWSVSSLLLRNDRAGPQRAFGSTSQGIRQISDPNVIDITPVERPDRLR